jgi:hypothetical protein
MMTLLHRRLAAVGIVGVAIVALSACTAPEPTSQVDAEGQLCTDLEAFGASLRGLTDLDPATASVEDVDAARASIQDSWDAVKASAEDVADADDTAVESAWQDVVTAIDAIPTDVPLSEAIGPVQTAADEVRGAFDEMQNGIGCG